tara:strand:- start:49 stop:282 length:234 start_codon:yes stop_codon:yes gene_type:complete
MDIQNSVKQRVMDIDNVNVKNKIWTNEEFEMKKNIEKCAHQDLSRKLTLWWDDQILKRKKDNTHRIEPFMIWQKRSL